jgi:hypothetical protein
MKTTTRSATSAMHRCALVLAMAIPAGYGCSTTTGGSTETTPVSVTMTGAESTVGQPIEAVDAKTKDVLASNGITIEDHSTENNGDHREYKGKANELDVTITLDREGPQVTKVEVTAKKNLVEYNKDFAKKLNEQISQSPA